MSPLMLAATVDENLIGLIAVTGAFSVAIVGIIGGVVAGIVKNKQREESRREIAAYVAEGSISPADAAKLISAGRSFKDLMNGA